MSWLAQPLATIVGGILVLVATLGALFVQRLLRTRGDVTLHVRPWRLLQQGEFTARLREIPHAKEVLDRNPSTVVYRTTVRIHNQKDVSVGLLDLYISVYAAEEQIMELRPDAEIRYTMTVQDILPQNPFEAATLPAQQVVVFWLKGQISEEENIAKFARCTRVELAAHLSNGQTLSARLATYD
jgi:hypothetical protein